VAWSDKECQNCGALTGQVWMAVVATSSPEVELAVFGSQEERLPGGISQPRDSAASAEDAIGADEAEQITRGTNVEEVFLLEKEETEKEETEKEETSTAMEGEFDNLDADETGSMINLPGGASPSSSGQEQQQQFTGDFLKGKEPENFEGLGPGAARTSAPALGDAPEEVPLPEEESAEMASGANSALGPGEYIDCQKRYQLLETLPPRKQGDVAVVRVLDCQPLQISLLEALLDTREMPTQKTNTPSGVETLVKSENTEIEALVTPEIAQGYLSLKCQFPYHLPAVHDAWQQKGEQVVLLEDCSGWPLLSVLWENDGTPQLQLVDWLYQMSELWIALEAWHCRQSLLELDNLRVYPDLVGDNRPVCLQRLYSEGAEVKLEDLMKLWLELFHRSQRTLFGPLADFVHDLRSGNLKEIEEVRSRLQWTREQLKQEEEPSSPATRLQSGEDFDEETAIGEQTTFIRARQLVALEAVGRTHVGRTREHNEDFFGIQTQIDKVESPNGKILDAKGLYIICDGMGGHAGGEIASKLAVDILKQYFKASWQRELPSEATIRQGILDANQAIYDLNQEEVRSGSARMGTTLVMAAFRNTKVAIAHVGDSRIYRFTRSRGLEQVTVDHEVGQREIKRGVDPQKAYSRPDAYQLTQALGPRDEDYVRPEVQLLDLDEDTLLILASDGLTDNNVLERYSESHVAPLLEPQSNLEEGVEQLIALANEENGHDNITAIAIAAKVQPRR
jgi:protein phosphatase